ncbi:MAG: DMT family transporter [Caldilineales bacterium]|nr:DMT family transporter [Caldilineales bacterium]
MQYTRARTTNKLDPQRLALVTLTIGIGAIAFSPIFVRLSDVGANAVAFWRLTLAIPLLWLWSWNSETPKRIHRTRPHSLVDFAPLVAMGVVFALDLIAWHQAIRLTSVANATFFPNMAPLLVSIVAWRFMGEKLRPIFVMGLLMAILGIAFMVRASAAGGESNIIGDALGLLTAFFYASYILLVKKMRAHFDAGTILLVVAITGGSLLFVVTQLTGEQLFPAALAGWAVLLALAWFSHAGGQGLIAHSLAHLPASFSSVSLLGQPVLAAVIAWLLLGEVLPPLQVAGGVLVLVGIILARKGSV